MPATRTTECLCRRRQPPTTATTWERYSTCSASTGRPSGPVLRHGLRARPVPPAAAGGRRPGSRLRIRRVGRVPVGERDRAPRTADRAGYVRSGRADDREMLPTLLMAAASPDVVELVATMMRDFRPTGVRPAVTALGAADLRDVLTTIAVPTLLIYGDADVRSPADVVGRNMHTRIPGSTLVVIPDAPHMVNLEQPEALNTAIRRFACED